MMPHKQRLRAILIGLSVTLVALALLGGQALAQGAQPPPVNGLAMDLGLLRVQMDSTHFRLDWSVIGSGGGDLGSPHFQLSSTLGQATVGEKSGTHYELCDGFWCMVGRFIQRIFMPLIQR